MLLVEDDDADALIFEDLLADAAPGSSVARARTAGDAETQAGDAHDCVILDLGLPDAEDLDALHRVLGRTDDVPVIVLTGDVDDRRGVRAVAAGAQDYLVKGQAEPATLRRSIHYAIQRCRAEASERKLRDAELHARENARLERGLLPRPVVGDARVRIHTGSRPGRARTLLGGDFFDVVETADGVLHAMIGDVSGHGPDEAALGVCLRVAWRALVLAGANAVDALAGVEEVLVHERLDPDHFATVTSISVRPDRRSAEVLTAGHPAPVLLTGDAPPHVLHAQPAPPLGVLPGAPIPVAEAELPAVGRLLLYTDGLIEGRLHGAAERLGQDRLVELLVAHDAAGDPAQLIPRLIAHVEELNGGALADDVAAVLVEVHAR